MSQRDPGETLDFLVFFHYAVGALAAMISLVPAVFLFVGASLADPALEPTVRTPGATAVHWIWIGITVLALAVGFGYAALMIVAGRSLQLRRRWALCRAAALLSCLFLPLGTILGVVTLVILTRPEVRAGFR